MFMPGTAFWPGYALVYIRACARLPSDETPMDTTTDHWQRNYERDVAAATGNPDGFNW